VVHLANIAHGRVEAELLRQVNVEGTRHAAELAAAQNVRRFVYLSSVKAIGEETAGKPFDSATPAAPGDEYGRAKLAAEAALKTVAAESGIEIAILRPPLVYGPRVRANFLALLRAVARGWPLPLASVSNRRSLVYLGNLCDAIARCLRSPAAAGGTFFVSDGAPVSTPALCRAIGNALGRPARLFPFPPRLLEFLPPMRKLTRSLEVDDSQMRHELGWRPPFSLDEGLRATASWYRAR
jgi:nucleoside-diphosphate-sugar epimerase